MNGQGQLSHARWPSAKVEGWAAYAHVAPQVVDHIPDHHPRRLHILPRRAVLPPVVVRDPSCVGSRDALDEGRDVGLPAQMTTPTAHCIEVCLEGGVQGGAVGKEVQHLAGGACRVHLRLPCGTTAADRTDQP